MARTSEAGSRLKEFLHGVFQAIDAAVGLLATVAVTAWLTRIAKRAEAEKVESCSSVY